MSYLVYRYGLLGPTKGQEDIEDQMRAAHRYANKLTEIERERRAAVDAALIKAGLAEHEERVALLEHKLGSARRAVSESRAGHGKVDKDAALSVSMFREELRAARAARKEARKALLPKAQPQLDALKEEYAQKMRDARAECGVYWGTYTSIEQAAWAARSSMTPPRFRSWRGDGSVGVQIQKGMATGAVTDCKDTRLRLDMTPVAVPDRGGRALPRLWMRIGSVGRDPVWAEWPVIVDRPLPAEARVKWAKVVRRRVAAHYQWYLLVTLEGVEAIEQCGEGVVALDLRWRSVQSEGGATVAAGAWSDGEDGGVIECPASVPKALGKVASLRGIRDKHIAPVRAALVAWRDANKNATEHIERMSNVGQWQAAARFAALALWWRTRRVKGDEDVLAYLEQWRVRDKHLWEWEANARQKALLRRREAYRVAAAGLARRYSTLVLEKLDLSSMAQEPKPEDAAKSEGHKARSQRTVSAPAELRLSTVNAFRRRGGTIIEVPACAGTTAMLQAVERSGETKQPGPARSKRFKVLRGIPTDQKHSTSVKNAALETGGANA